LHNIDSNNGLPIGWISTDLETVSIILDHKRIPVNSKEREERIIGKQEHQLFPYYGAAGKVGLIDDFIFDGEYVLLGEDGAPFLDVFKNKAYLVSGKFWVNNHAHILKSLGSNKYLCHYLNNINYKEYITGTTRYKLNQTSMKNILVKFPPLPEQKRIVAKIEEMFSDLDNSVANLQKVKAHLKTYRQAVLKYAFEGNLTAVWRAAYEPLPAENLVKQINAEREKNYQQQLTEWEQRIKDWEKSGKKGKKEIKPKKPKELPPLTEAELTEIPNLPKGWSWIKLGSLIDQPKYGTSKKCSYEAGEIGVLRIPNIIKNKISSSDLKYAEFGDEEINTYNLKSGDLLIIRSNGSLNLVGKCALVTSNQEQFLFAGYLVRLRPIYSRIRSKYLLYIFSSYLLRKQIEFKAKSTSGVNNINSNEIKNLVLPLCSISEQNKIVQEIESRLSVADKLEETINESLQKAEALRQSILKKAFEGNLVPQDPNDEPAEKLLESILLEKRAKSI
jgi:type I restriction enzyme S subunit